MYLEKTQFFILHVTIDLYLSSFHPLNVLLIFVAQKQRNWKVSRITEYQYFKFIFSLTLLVKVLKYWNGDLAPYIVSL